MSYFPIHSTTPGHAGSNGVGDDNSYTNFTPSSATIKGAISAIDTTFTSITSSLNNLTNSNISASAAIAYSKLALLGGSTNDILTQNSSGYIQVSGILSTNLFLADGSVTATSAFNLGGFTPINSGTPVNPNDLTNKSYVDTAVAGLGGIMTTAGDMIYENSFPAPTRLAIGTAGQVLTVSAGLPTWSTPASSGANTALSNLTGFTANGLVYATSSSAFATDSNISYNGNQVTLDVVDSYGGFKVKGRSGGEASFSLQPDNVSDGSAGQWIFYTNGSGLNSQNDFAMYNSALGLPCIILQAATGYVGINRNNPQSYLDVNGNINSSSITTAGLTVDGMSTFAENISVTNALVDGVPGIASMITTGDPNTPGLIIQGTSYNMGGFGPANPTINNSTSNGNGTLAYSAGTLTLSGASGTPPWDAAADTVQGFVGNGYIQASCGDDESTNKQSIFGFETSFSASSPTYNNIAYGIYFGGSPGNVYIIESGVFTELGATYLTTDVFQVQRSGTSIVYSKNGTTIHTTTGVSSGSMFYGSFAMAGLGGGASLTGITMFYGALTDQEADLLRLNGDSGTTLTKVDANGNLIFNVVSSGLEFLGGSNARTGSGTLSGGTVTIANTSVTANSLIFTQNTTSGSLTNVGDLTVYPVTPGTSFTVTSTNPLDTSTFWYFIVEQN